MWIRRRWLSLGSLLMLGAGHRETGQAAAERALKTSADGPWASGLARAGLVANISVSVSRVPHSTRGPRSCWVWEARPSSWEQMHKTEWVMSGRSVAQCGQVPLGSQRHVAK